jgi:hypothetical protein
MRRLFLLVAIPSVALNVYLLNQESEQAKRLATKQRSEETLTQTLEQLKAKLIQTKERISLLSDENTRLARATANPPSLAPNLPDGQNPASNRATPQVTSSDPFVASILSIAENAGAINRAFHRAPEKEIPEMCFVKESTWLGIAQRYPTLNSGNGSDETMSEAMAAVREAAKNEFGSMAGKAVAKFKKSTGGNLPTDINQLKPYFDVPVSDAMLQRYQIGAGDSPIALSLKSAPKDKYDIVLTERAPVDRRFDSRYSLFIGGGIENISMHTSISDW